MSKYTVIVSYAEDELQSHKKYEVEANTTSLAKDEARVLFRGESDKPILCTMAIKE